MDGPDAHVGGASAPALTGAYGGEAAALAPTPPATSGSPAGSGGQRQEPPASTGSQAGATGADGGGAEGETASQIEYMRFEVIGLDRAKKDTFKFEVSTNLRHFKRPQCVKERTYIEFEKLRAHFVATYPQAIAPPLPSQFSNALTAEENERRVKAAMTRFLARVGEHLVLRKDDGLRAFVESEFAFNPATKIKYKSSVSSLREKFSRMVPSSSSSSSGASSPRSTGSAREIAQGSSEAGHAGEFVIDDDDVAFERMRKDAQINESMGSSCGKALANVVKARKAIAFSYIDVASKAGLMSSLEANASWAAGLRRFGKCLQAMGELEQEQASSENAILGDIFDMHVRVARAIQEAVSTRASLKAEHDSVIRATEKKRKDLEKMKTASAIRPERVDEALEDLEESKRSELQSAAHLSRVSHALRTTEVGMLQSRQHADALQALSDHALRAVEHERAQLRLWESCLPDISTVVSETTVVGETVDARGVAERLAGAFL